MILQRIPVIRSLFGNNGKAAAEVSRRWQRAFGKDPELAKDIIRQSGFMSLQRVEMVEGVPQLAPLNPYDLAYEAGKRDFALLLISQGQITIEEINQLMESSDEY